MLNIDKDDSLISLNINGHVFTIRADSELAERVAMLAGEASVKADNARECDERDISGVCGFLCRIVNTLIGENTVETVFGDEEPDVFDLCDIISYVCDEFSEYRRKRLKRLNENHCEEVSA